jgi:RNA 3'-terminal phosphate cyclase (ATP)
VCGSGLKAQHVASLSYLAAATDAETSGLEVGSHTLDFRPRLKPSQLLADGQRKVRIDADSEAASTLLIFQAILPFLLFAGNERDEPIEVEISGGTNVSWSPSWDYVDQVLLPTLEDTFGVVLERRLVRRGWSAGTPQRGEVWFRVRPVRLGETLRLREPSGVGLRYEKGDFEVKWVDVSVLAPGAMLERFQNAVVRGLEEVLPRAQVNLKVVEDSGRESRVYVLLVARSATLRWGRDVLTSMPKKTKKGQGNFEEYVARKVCQELYDEVESRGTVDEYLQDQLVVFQALAEGKTSFPRSGDRTVEDELGDLTLADMERKEKALEPFGEGSMHTKTARWVTRDLLPGVEWYKDGRMCQGVGMRMEKSMPQIAHPDQVEAPAGVVG